MSNPETKSPAPDTEGFTAFVGARLIARGSLAEVARAVHAHASDPTCVFEDATGHPVELDLRGTAEDALARLSSATTASKPTRGRPKLGVTAREVTLLPRHWDWLATQPGGASAALRRLVEEARRHSGSADALRQAQEGAYRVMTAMAGNLPGYEEAVRALFAGDRTRLHELSAVWPTDLAAYVNELASKSDPRPQAG